MPKLFNCLSETMVGYRIRKFSLELAYYIYFVYNLIILKWINIYYCFCESFLHEIDLHDIRIPKHIAISFTNEMDCIHLDSIARILFWCRQMGVKYITLYDDLGGLKDKRKEILELVDSKFKSDWACEKFLNHFDILSRSDGRPKFIEGVRDLIKLPPKDINIDLVQERLGWPMDPELLIVFGTPLCLHGFPPWPLRLTEIFTIATHRAIPRKVFIDCLRRYSRTSQRVGA